MGVYISAHIQDENKVFISAPMEPFANSPLIGIYSEEEPYFKFTDKINQLLCSAGFKFDFSSVGNGGKILNMKDVAELYGMLLQKSYDSSFSSDPNFKGILHFLGICLANLYPVSIG